MPDRVDDGSRDVAVPRPAGPLAGSPEVRARDILASFPDLLFRIDASGRFLDCYTRDSDALLMKPSSFLGRRLEDVLPPDLAARTRAALDKVLRDGRLDSYDYRLEFGSLARTFESRVVPASPGEVLVIARETTPCREADEAQQQSEQSDTIVRTLPDGFALVDSSSLRFLQVNDALCRMLGWNRDALLTMTVPEIVADDTGDGVRRRSQLVADQGSDRFEALIRCRSGARIETDIAVSFLPGTSRLVAIVRDVTQRNRDLRLTGLRNRILDVFLSVPDDRMYLEVLRVLQDATDSTAGLFGPVDDCGVLAVPPCLQELSGARRLAGRFPPTDASVRPAYPWDEALANRTPVVRIADRADGDAGDASLSVPIHHLERVVGLVHLEGRPEGYGPDEQRLVETLCTQIAPVLVARLQRESALRELRASETRFRDVTFGMGDMVWETDRDFRISYYSPQVQGVLGFAPVELLGRHLSEILLPDEAPMLADRFLPLILRGETLRDIETTNVTRDGRRMRLLSTVVPLFDEQGRFAGLRGIDRDITEKRLLEAEALKAQKLESLGVLAGGIAHDFNNLLTAILGNVSLVLDSGGMPEDSARRLEDAEKAVVRAQDLTRQLLTFARGGAPVRRPSSLGAVVAESASFVLSGSNVRSSLRIPEDLWTVDIDPGQISQVVQNLVLNAVQAMPLGGTVRVSVDNCIIDRDFPLHVAPGRYVQIEVEDEGVGIPSDVGDRVFEPYFSTKSRGSGLGLPVSYSIVRNHLGHIGFESEPGKGTRFRVLLPAVDATPALPAAPVRPPPGRRGRLLVMDDEPMVRDVLAAMLASGGYESSVVADGSEAVAAWRTAIDQGRPFDAVLLDLTVPGGMGGLEALERIRAADPEVRAIVSSGYHNAPVMSDAAAHGFRGVIAKPFRPREVLSVVGHVLDGTAP